MKTVLFLATAAMAGCALAGDVVPTAFSKERYEETRGKSPFAEETRTVIIDTGDREIDNWVITGMGELDDGRTWVAVRKNGADRSMTFTGNEPNEQGISIARVNWGAEWKDSSVVLRQKGEESEVKFAKDSQPVTIVSDKNKRTFQEPPNNRAQRPKGETQTPTPTGGRQRERGGSGK